MPIWQRPSGSWSEVSIDEPSFLILEYLRRWDVWNIKTLLRGKFYGATDTEIVKYLVPAGELSPEYLDELAKKDTIQDIISAFDGTDYASALAQYDGKNLARSRTPWTSSTTSEWSAPLAAHCP